MSNKIVNLFNKTDKKYGKGANKTIEFPTDEKKIESDIEKMNYMYFSRMVDENLDLFADQMLAVGMIRKRVDDGKIHAECSRYLYMARESLISFLMKVNGFTPTIKKAAEETIELIDMSDGEFDLPLYTYTLKEEEKDETGEEG